MAFREEIMKCIWIWEWLREAVASPLLCKIHNVLLIRCIAVGFHLAAAWKTFTTPSLAVKSHFDVFAARHHDSMKTAWLRDVRLFLSAASVTTLTARLSLITKPSVFFFFFEALLMVWRKPREKLITDADGLPVAWTLIHILNKQGRPADNHYAAWANTPQTSSWGGWSLVCNRQRKSIAPNGSSRDLT